MLYIFHSLGYFGYSLTTRGGSNRTLKYLGQVFGPCYRLSQIRIIVLGTTVASTGYIPIVKIKEELKFCLPCLKLKSFIRRNLLIFFLDNIVHVIHGLLCNAALRVASHVCRAGEY